MLRVFVATATIASAVSIVESNESTMPEFEDLTELKEILS